PRLEDPERIIVLERKHGERVPRPDPWRYEREDGPLRDARARDVTSQSVQLRDQRRARIPEEPPAPQEILVVPIGPLARAERRVARPLRPGRLLAAGQYPIS